MPYSIRLPLKSTPFREEGVCIWRACKKEAKIFFEPGQTTFTDTEKLSFCFKHGWTAETFNKRVLRIRNGPKTKY